MTRQGFYLNMNTCVGCGACQTACKEAHGLQPGEFYRRTGVVSAESGGKKVYFPFSGACNHCAEPRCVAACPTGAMHKAADGTVIHENGICIGCGACVWNCPYGAVSFSVRTGVAQKCDACAERRAEGKNPVCVDACPTRSLRFGALDEIMRETGAEFAALPIHPDRGLTDPSFIVKLPKALKGGEKE